jgi:Zn-dependent protease with chaperone function
MRQGDLEGRKRERVADQSGVLLEQNKTKQLIASLVVTHNRRRVLKRQQTENNASVLKEAAFY